MRFSPSLLFPGNRFFWKTYHSRVYTAPSNPVLSEKKTKLPLLHFPHSALHGLALGIAARPGETGRPLQAPKDCCPQVFITCSQLFGMRPAPGSWRHNCSPGTSSELWFHIGKFSTAGYHSGSKTHTTSAVIHSRDLVIGQDLITHTKYSTVRRCLTEKQGKTKLQLSFWF
jgi:hypothetical protein